MKDEILGESTAALVKRASSGEIANWDDDKKRDFVKTFDDRARVARYILLSTGELILDGAHRRQFIGAKHVEMFGHGGVHKRHSRRDHHELHDKGGSYHEHTVGGRSVNDLSIIAEERANLVLKELPPLKKAVQVIDAVTAKKIERKETIIKSLKDLKKKLEGPDLAGPLKMDEVNPKTSVGDFMQMAKDRVKTRRKIFSRMDDLAIEGQDLEAYINKKLYKGLPGLSDAVVSVVKQHFDRAIAMDEMDRRVGEKVMYGDSAAALEMLKGFEKDEQTIPEEIKAEFRSALEKLKVSKKQLGAGKKSKK